jgi:hypothetical protein
MTSLALRHDGIRDVQRELRRRWRREFARALEQKVREGVVDLHGSPEDSASLLSALAQGIAIECLTEPEWDRTEAIEQAAVAARYVLGALSPSA